MSVNVLLVDDHAIMRQGLRVLLESDSNVKVIAEADDGRSAIDKASNCNPDIIVMDISMPNLNGIEATRQITRENRSKVIALSVHSDRRFVSEMFKAGACGYLPKHCAYDEISKAIEEITQGRMYLSPKITVVIEDYVRNLPKKQSAYVELGSREREILQLLSEGKSTKEMAAILHVSTKTIEWYRREIMNKLDIHTIAGLIKYAIREGLTSADM